MKAIRNLCTAAIWPNKGMADRLQLGAGATSNLQSLALMEQIILNTTPCTLTSIELAIKTFMPSNNRDFAHIIVWNAPDWFSLLGLSLKICIYLNDEENLDPLKWTVTIFLRSWFFACPFFSMIEVPPPPCSPLDGPTKISLRLLSSDWFLLKKSHHICNVKS